MNLTVMKKKTEIVLKSKDKKVSNTHLWMNFEDWKKHQEWLSQDIDTRLGRAA